jgi:hypothetical protein
MYTSPYVTRCKQCPGLTSRKYARKHNGLCKACVTGESKQDNTPTREQRILEHGYQAYAREEGHYDTGDN